MSTLALWIGWAVLVVGGVALAIAIIASALWIAFTTLLDRLGGAKRLAEFIRWKRAHPQEKVP